MSTGFPIIALFVGQLAINGDRMEPQCLTQGEEAEHVFDYALSLVTDPSFADERDEYQLVVADSSDVQLISVETTCQAAAEALMEDFDLAVAPPVHLIRVTAGSTVRYLVAGPEFRAGEYHVTVVTDENFAYLVGFTS